jgi:hypothetical protein
MRFNLIHILLSRGDIGKYSLNMRTKITNPLRKRSLGRWMMRNLTWGGICAYYIYFIFVRIKEILRENISRGNILVLVICVSKTSTITTFSINM